jgi:beta-galactosidase
MMNLITKRTKIILIIQILILSYPFMILPQQNNEWNNKPAIFLVNCKPTHATLMPYSNVLEAVDGNRTLSPFYSSPSGNWKSKLANNPAGTDTTFHKDNADVSSWANIEVPGSWQLQGHDYPIYTNANYPWTGRENPPPPQAPVVYNPVGSYRREFIVPQSWNGGEIFLSFEGVESAFYVWINGIYVGYSEDSFTSKDFGITEYLRHLTEVTKIVKLCSSCSEEPVYYIALSGSASLKDS